MSDLTPGTVEPASPSDGQQKGDGMSQTSEKRDVEDIDDVVGRDFEVDAEELPPGYFTSSFFLGSMAAISLGLVAGVSGFGYAAPILANINADIGPDPNIVWVALSYTLTSAVALTIIGRVSDIFGRRWIFVGGAVLGVIGSIVCATAQSVNALIGGTTIIGIAAATQLSYYYVMGELVPMKYRLAGNAVCYLFTIPGSGIAPVVSWSLMLDHPKVGWRGGYYILIALNTASLACWLLFYHPPTFRMKHGNASVMKYIKEFDYVGTTIYTGGLLILIMGLNWGGTVYAWDSAAVISTIVVGFVALVAFVLWEIYANLKEPLVPMHLFNNRSWNASVILSGLGASVYYAFAIVWPSMVNVLYNDGSQIKAAWFMSFVGLFIVTGEIVGGFLAKYIGYLKWQCVVSVAISAICFGCMATSTVDSKVAACTLVSLGVFFIGWAESLAITMVTLSAKDQNNLGSASGVAGSIRFFISSIAATVYSVILSNRLTTTISEQVPSAVIDAGLPSSSVADFIGALGGTVSMEDVKGVTADIIAAGTAAYKEANVLAYRTVFLTSVAFSGVALISSLLLPDFDHLLTNKVATTLQRSNNGNEVVGEKR
ncbi:fungal trichothecene efflux pump [Coniochaeta sp. 2T2.1]|nr:fungal trichothecene efflux pump [Coniochaeta sp. 2T2.1]